jgi:hypothetical protein
MLTAGYGLFAPTHCVHCGCWHAGACPRVKAVEYHPDGTVKRVEYHEPPPVVELNRSIIPHTTESPVKRILLATLVALTLAGLTRAGGLHHHHAGTVFRQRTFIRGAAPGAVVVPGASYYVRQQAVLAVPVQQQLLVQQAPVYQQSYAVQQVPVQQAVVQQAAVYQQRSFAVQQAPVYQQPALAVDTCVPAAVPAPAPAPDYCAPTPGAGLAPGYAPGVGRGVFRQRTVQRTY